MAHKHDISNKSIKREESSINIDPEDRETLKALVDDELVHK